jgi:hypothetical protein
VIFRGIADPREPPFHLALELVDDARVRHAAVERGTRHRGLLGAVEALEQREQPVEALPTRGGERVVGVQWEGRAGHISSPSIMPLADTYQEIVDSLPSDWTDLELDLRVQEDRYVDAAVLLVTCNAQPYTRHDWHWRLIVAHHFGHAAAPEVVHGTLKLLDDADIPGELVFRDVRAGRAEIVQDWGRGESFRQEFRRLRAQ